MAMVVFCLLHSIISISRRPCDLFRPCTSDQGCDRCPMAQLCQLQFQTSNWLCWIAESRSHVLYEFPLTVALSNARISKGINCSSLCFPLKGHIYDSN